MTQGDLKPNLEKLLKSNQKELNTLGKSYGAQLPNLHTFLVDWIKKNRQPSGVLSASISASQTQSLLNQAGLPLFADPSFLQESFKKAGDLAIKAIPEAGDIFAISNQTISIALDGVRLEMAAVATKTTKKVEALLQEAAIVPLPISAMAQRLSAETNLLKSQARTIVNTGLAQVQRQAQVEVAEQFDPKELIFLYIGPDDQITRPFCHELEGFACTKKQIARLNNKQGLGVMSSGGGYNCRHRWLPISRAYAKDKGIELCTANEIAKANSAAGRAR